MLSSLIDRLSLASRHRKFFRVGDIELQLLDLLARPGSLALDVGANIGVYSYGLSRIGRKTIAFEPIPELAASINNAKLPGVECRNLALSDFDGDTVLQIPVHTKHSGDNAPAANIRGGDQNARAVPVQVRKLDSLGLADVGFIKIDVEGVEKQFLEGARETVVAGQPVVEIELVEWLAPGCIAWTTDWFKALGYEGFYVAERKRVEPIEAFDGTIRMDNFIFAPKARAADLKAAITARLNPG